MNKHRATRRDVLKTAMAASAAIFPLPAFSQSASPRVVVIGGGFGGAACARALKRTGTKLSVTLIEPNRVYTACPMSNAAIAGLRELTSQEFGYGRLQAEGIELVASAAESVDAATRGVMVTGGQRIEYDRLVLAPGIDFRWDALPGYSREVSAAMPHAWIGGDQISLLTRQIAAMDDGGVVVISVPVTPSRCPPAPYERASLIAYLLKTRKPRSKVIVLDAKDSFTMQRQFQGAWKQLYSGVLEYVSLSDGGLVTEVDPSTRTVATDFDKYTPAVANIIPQQKAGAVAELAGVADRTGWCPVDPVSFESRLQPNIHVIGDSAIAGAMPRSASAAASQGKICATAIAALLAGNTPPPPTLASSCFSLIAPDYAISQTGRYRP
ncbi:MAG TPA: FAD/NAD(P)-binding oxidoreductase, partial [Pseudolabrys sp.]